jgi:hypothetical protein
MIHVLACGQMFFETTPIVLSHTLLSLNLMMKAEMLYVNAGPLFAESAPT